LLKRGWGRLKKKGLLAEIHCSPVSTKVSHGVVLIKANTTAIIEGFDLSGGESIVVNADVVDLAGKGVVAIVGYPADVELVFEGGAGDST